MTKLNSDIHPLLSDAIIQELQRKNVTTICGFVLDDSEKLATVTGLSHKDILEIKQNLSKKYGGVLRNAFDFLTTEQNNIVLTNIPSLDNLLKGGLYPGQIYEVCGLSSSGKTQLCLTITTNVALRPDSLVRYIDTKKDFCSSAVRRIMITKMCSEQVIGETMERIKVCCVESFGKLLRVLQWLKIALKDEKEEFRTRILIIDSLPAIIFRYSNDYKMISELNHLANICRFIANEYKLSIVSVNSIAQWDTAGGNIIPSLGKYWFSVPNTRLLIEKLGLKKRKITILKSFQLETNSTCVLNICNAGLTVLN